MKRDHRLPLTPGFCLLVLFAAAQPKQPPATLTSAFAKLFPNASKTEWTEKTDNFTVFFDRNDRKCEAKFTKSGDWLSTEEPINWDSLPAPVLQALKTGKYASWTRNAAYAVRSSDGSCQFHLVLAGRDGGRKLLFFSSDGKLIKER
ncbi:MAG TPA: hypothetical protein VHE34_03555 [Puia sp.]|uniref:hypothetical protein n=1 Tax=Puia sp. TaxID=2045100 RepID=UPI002D04AE85|nr:hypothetical protein [Puia sp.]HVU94269.1 hypothetical protein [Puia sp.]